MLLHNVSLLHNALISDGWTPRTCTGDGRKFDVRARNHSLVAANAQREAGQRVRAWESVATLIRVVPGSRHFGIVCRDDRRWQVKQCSARV